MELDFVINRNHRRISMLG